MSSQPITFTDANGNPLSLPQQQPQPSFTDVNGKPLSLNFQGQPAAGGPNVPGADPSSLIQHSPMAVPGVLTALGSLAGPGGSLVGSGAGSLLKTLAPSVFGEPPSSPEDVLWQGVKDAGLQSIPDIGAAAGEANGLYGKVGALISKIPGSSRLPGVKTAQDATDAFHLNITNKLKDLQDAYDNENAAETAHQNYSGIANKAQQDAQLKAAADAHAQALVKHSKDLDTYNTTIKGKTDTLNSAYESEQQAREALDAINPNSDVPKVQQQFTQATKALADAQKVTGKALTDFNKSSSIAPPEPPKPPDYTTFKIKPGDEATQADISQKALKAAQGNTAKAQQSFDEASAKGPELPETQEPSILSTKGAGRYLLRAAAVGGIGHALGSYEAGAGVVLTASQLAKMAKNPQLGAAILAAQKTPASSDASVLINKVILHNLIGQTVDLSDGTKATIDQNGNPQPTK